MAVALTRVIPFTRPVPEEVLTEFESLPGLIKVTADSDSSTLTVRYDLGLITIEQVLGWLSQRRLHPTRSWIQRLRRGFVPALRAPSPVRKRPGAPGEPVPATGALP